MVPLALGGLERVGTMLFFEDLGNFLNMLSDISVRSFKYIVSVCNYVCIV